MNCFSQFIFLACFSRTRSECAPSDGACAASDTAEGIDFLQVNMVPPRTAHREETHLGEVEAKPLRSPPTRLKPMQSYHATTWDRYPTIFKGLKDLLQESGGEKQKILSFGCSDGTECHTLRTYFPNAIIDGVDVAADLVAKVRAENSDPGIKFYNDLGDLTVESYDAILAMGVLTDEGDPEHVHHLEHNSYVRAIDMLHSLLRSGGYLVMYNADYPFSEYPRHFHFQNMCSQSVPDQLVPAADVMYDRNDDLTLRAMPRGMCSTSDKFCIESGYGRKFNKAGDEVQSERYPFGQRGNETMGMSNGCKYAGTFFKKLSSAADRSTRGQALPRAAT